MKEYKRIPSYRRYWNQPNLIRTDRKLSKEQRRKVIEKFLKLVEKRKERIIGKEGKLS